MGFAFLRVPCGMAKMWWMSATCLEYFLKILHSWIVDVLGGIKTLHNNNHICSKPQEVLQLTAMQLSYLG